MLAKSWAREAGAPRSRSSMAVAAACSAARRKATAAAGAVGTAGTPVARRGGDGEALPAGTIRRDRSCMRCARCSASSGSTAAVRAAGEPPPAVPAPAPASWFRRSRSRAAYRVIISCSAVIAARSRPTPGAGDGGLASTSAPSQPDTATSGSTAAAAITTRRVGSAATEPPAWVSRGVAPRCPRGFLACHGPGRRGRTDTWPGGQPPRYWPARVGHWPRRPTPGRLVTVRVRSEAHSAPGALADPQAVTGRITGTDAHGVRLDVAGESREFGYSELGPGRIQIEFAPLDDGEGGLGEGGLGEGGLGEGGLGEGGLGEGG